MGTSAPVPYYDVDGITIYHADCADVLPTVDPAEVDLLLTDPPYGMRLNTDNRSRGGNDFARVHGDDQDFDPAPLLGFGRCILWGANYYADRLPSSPSWMVWDKRDGVLTNTNADVELAWTNLGGVARSYHYLWAGMVRAGERGRTLHPTQKPVSLMMWCLEQARVERGGLVLDPYMGSGPLAVACRDFGIRYVGIELVREYVDIAVGRLSQQALDLTP